MSLSLTRGLAAPQQRGRLNSNAKWISISSDMTGLPVNNLFVSSIGTWRRVGWLIGGDLDILLLFAAVAEAAVVDSSLTATGGLVSFVLDAYGSWQDPKAGSDLPDLVALRLTKAGRVQLV